MSLLFNFPDMTDVSLVPRVPNHSDATLKISYGRLLDLIARSWDWTENVIIILSK